MVCACPNSVQAVRNEEVETSASVDLPKYIYLLPCYSTQTSVSALAGATLRPPHTPSLWQSSTSAASTPSAYLRSQFTPHSPHIHPLPPFTISSNVLSLIRQYTTPSPPSLYLRSQYTNLTNLLFNYSPIIPSVIVCKPPPHLFCDIHVSPFTTRHPLFPLLNPLIHAPTPAPSTLTTTHHAPLRLQFTTHHLPNIIPSTIIHNPQPVIYPTTPPPSLLLFVLRSTNPASSPCATQSPPFTAHYPSSTLHHPLRHSSHSTTHHLPLRPHSQSTIYYPTSSPPSSFTFPHPSIIFPSVIIHIPSLRPRSQSTIHYPTPSPPSSFTFHHPSSFTFPYLPLRHCS
ncbi:hypothetical protein CVT24_000344 [Panaeolus cyanescens]|uniref:Uncharacterized protein n=1 Tax=Panaeolus cyanescens TaxID=181874 RepID=A0A409YCZ0_9AGAR|nr:hypothetical protein CVT24_000344 [Panaeolus cyanescens]